MQEIVHWSDKAKHVTAWIICRPYQHIFKQNNAILCRKKYLAVLKNIWDFRPGRYISLMPVIPTQEQTLFDDIPARTPYWLYHSNIYKHRRQHKILILLATSTSNFKWNHIVPRWNYVVPNWNYIGPTWNYMVPPRKKKLGFFNFWGWKKLLAYFCDDECEIGFLKILF